MKGSSIPFRRWLSAVILLALVGATATPAAVYPTNTPYPVAQTTFVVTLPEPLLAGELLSLVVFDEVTGLPLRPSENRYQMTPRDTVTYTANLALTYNSVVKYRYQRVVNGTPFMEDTALDTSIRYRIHSVAGPAEVVPLCQANQVSEPKGEHP